MTENSKNGLFESNCETDVGKRSYRSSWQQESRRESPSKLLVPISENALLCCNSIQSSNLPHLSVVVTTQKDFASGSSSGEKRHFSQAKNVFRWNTESDPKFAAHLTCWFGVSESSSKIVCSKVCTNVLNGKCRFCPPFCCSRSHISSLRACCFHPVKLDPVLTKT